MGSEEVDVTKSRKRFKFSFPMLTDKSKSYDLEVSIEIPYFGCLHELCARIVNKFYIPDYVVSELQEALSNFIEKETDNYYDERAAVTIEQFVDDSIAVDELINEWEKVFTENTVEYGGDRFGSDDMELFSTVYHKLVHSPALEAVLQVEQSYALVVQDIIKQRDQHITELTGKQTDEMSKAIDEVNRALTEADVTALAGQHLEEHGMEIARWDSKLGAVQESQKRKYKEWLMSLLEQSCDSPINTPLSSPMSNQNQIGECNDLGEAPKLQESFTIHLGSQLKQMYNIRILSFDPLDLCKLRTSSSDDLEPQPQRLQTALALYSNDLCGLVLLSDNCLGSFSGITKDFTQISEMSTELHFLSMENQLENIRESVQLGVQWRKQNQVHLDTNLLTSSEQQLRKCRTKYLQTGDVYITKHSNLSEVHVVFHMVVDDSIKSNDINSRHPGILGLRNIIKCACSNDITTLTIPLLLAHEFTNEMTMNWCTKRAELVYKCVKGFMIEMTSWGGSELKNLQFLVPKGISEDIFSALATMLPSIFRVSNPLVLKATNSPQNVKAKTDKKGTK